MATDISPIFGLTLIALSEWAIIIGALIGLGGAGAVAGVIWRANRRHLQQQKEVDSARLARDLHRPWRNSPNFKKFLAEVNNPDIKDYDPELLDAFLDTFEVIATFWYTGSLNNTHTRSLFSANLKTIREDNHIMGHIKTAQQKNSRTFFYLRTLLRTSKEWDASPF